MNNENNLVQKTLLDIASKDRFAIVDGPFGTQLHASEYTDEGVPVVRVVNTSYSGKFLNENIVFITEAKAEKLRRSKVVPGDIIVAKTGATIGKSGIFPECYATGIIASSCVKLTVDESVADNQFVAYLIQSHDGQNKIIDAAGGSTRTTINTKPFGAISFLFPSKPEQTKIAEVLSTLDRAIEQTEALIAKQHRIKTGLMQDLLTKGIDEHGHIRSEATHAFKDSPLGRIPVEWDCRTAGSLLSDGALSEIQDGNHGELHPKSADFVPEGVPFVMASDIAGSIIDLVRVKRITEAQYRSLRIGFAKSRDVLLSHKASIGFVAVVPEDLTQLMLTPQVTYYRVGDSTQMNYRYLAQFFRSEKFQEPLKSLAKQSTRDYIGILAQQDLQIAYPLSITEQERIADMLSVPDQVIDEHLTSLNKLRALKIGLMHDLLTGERRVTPLLTRAVTL